MTDENTRLPSDSVVEALKPYLRHKSDCRLYANCVDYECTCGLCDILAAQPRDDVRELLKVARADLAFLHEQIQQHRPGTYRAGNTIARIDTALSQGDEQPDTDGLAGAYGRAVRALANAGSLQPTIGTVNLMLCDLGEDLGEVPLSALRTDRKAVLEEAAKIDGYEAAWREMHDALEWMHGNRALNKYLGWNFAAIAKDLIERAYPGLLEGELTTLPSDRDTIILTRDMMRGHEGKQTVEGEVFKILDSALAEGAGK